MIKSTNSNSVFPILLNRQHIFWLTLTTTMIVGLLFILKLFYTPKQEITLSKKIIGEKYINPLNEFEEGFSYCYGGAIKRSMAC